MLAPAGEAALWESLHLSSSETLGNPARYVKMQDLRFDRLAQRRRVNAGQGAAIQIWHRGTRLNRLLNFTHDAGCAREGLVENKYWGGKHDRGSPQDFIVVNPRNRISVAAGRPRIGGKGANDHVSRGPRQ